MYVTCKHAIIYHNSYLRCRKGVSEIKVGGMGKPTRGFQSIYHPCWCKQPILGIESVPVRPILVLSASYFFY